MKCSMTIAALEARDAKLLEKLDGAAGRASAG
jgi:hypothetical protein